MEITSTTCPSADTHKAGTYCHECGAYPSFRAAIVTKTADIQDTPESPDK